MVDNDTVVALENQHINPQRDKNQGKNITETVFYDEECSSSCPGLWCFDVHLAHGMKI
jgi:hypothetical protein